MKNKINTVLSFALIVVTVCCFVSCNCVSDPSTGDYGSITPPAMHNPQADLAGLNFEECKRYCVKGFDPMFPCIEDKLQSISVYSDSVVNTYYTELRNPISVLSEESIYDQIDVLINVNYPWNSPNAFGLSTEDYTLFDVECLKYPSGVMTAELKMSYFDADKTRLEFFGPESWQYEKNSLYSITIGEFELSVYIGYESGEVNADQWAPLKVDSTLDKDKNITLTRLYMTVFLDYDDVLYSFTMPILSYAGDTEEVYLPCKKMVALANEYYDGSYDIFTYSDEHLNELQEVCSDYVKARMLSKKIVEYLFSHYMGR